MAATVIGIWESGWMEPRLERRLWKQTLAAYGVSNWAMVPGEASKGSPLEFPSLEHALRSSFGTYIFLIPGGETPLAELEHPDDAVYIFGNAKESLRKYVCEEDITVNIESNNVVDMFAPVALAPVLRSRYLQRGY